MTRSRRSNRDHARKQNQPGVTDEVIEAQLETLLTPAIFTQSLYYRQLGLRKRLLNLPFMMAAVDGWQSYDEKYDSLPKDERKAPPFKAGDELGCGFSLLVG
jgi:hypothetical protein